MTNEPHRTDEESVADIIDRHQGELFHVRLDDDLVRKLRDEVGEDAIAEQVSELVKQYMQRKALCSYEKVYLRENGPFSEEADEWADAQIRKAGWGAPAWRGDEGE